MRKRRIFSGFCALLLVVTLVAMPLPVFAARTEKPIYTLPADLTLNAVQAGGAVLLVSLGTEEADDVLLFGKNEEVLRSPAALVRLAVGLTAMELIEEKKLNLDTDTGTYHSGCFDLIAGTGVSVLELPLNSVLTLRDLLTATMMQTAGDAAVTLAVTLAGSNAAFVERMNEVAAEIGCTRTSFSNVTGLEGGSQYTCCVDLYRLMRRAMSYPELRGMMGLAEYVIRPQNGSPITIINTNELIRTGSPNYCGECVFGRTGYTSEAGRCVVSVAQQDGYEYMAIVLGCPDKNAEGAGGLQYDDSRALYKWAFQKLSYTTLVAKGAVVDRLPLALSMAVDSVTLVAEQDVAIVVPADLDLKTIVRRVYRNPSEDAPVQKGDVYGKLELYINLDQKIGEVDLVASESVSRSQLLYVWRQVMEHAPWLYIGLGTVLVLLFGYMLLNLIHNRNRRKKKMRRVRQYK